MITLDRIREVLQDFRQNPEGSPLDGRALVKYHLLDGDAEDYYILMDFLMDKLCIEFSTQDWLSALDRMTVNKLVDRCWVLANEGA